MLAFVDNNVAKFAATTDAVAANDADTRWLDGIRKDRAFFGIIRKKKSSSYPSQVVDIVDHSTDYYRDYYQQHHR